VADIFLKNKSYGLKEYVSERMLAEGILLSLTAHTMNGKE
jgi:hypothetical protein